MSQLPIDNERKRIEQRKRLAQALQSQGSPQGQMMGRIFVAPRAGDFLASALGRTAGMVAGNRAERDEKSLDTRERKGFIDALGKLGGEQLPPEAMDALNNEQLGGLYGQQLSQRLKPPPAPEWKDVGDSLVLIDSKGQELQRVPKGATPDAALRETGEDRRWTTASGNAQLTADTAREGHQVTARGQDIGAATTVRGQDIGAQSATRGQDVTMRGQDLDSSTAAARLQAETGLKQSGIDQRKASQGSAVTRTLTAVEDALSMTGWRTTGLPGAMTRKLPGGGAGTDALALSKTVDTIKANLSFQELARMRAESPTGGALGSITERELELLGATVANLDPNQDAEQLKKELGKVHQHLKNIEELQGLNGQGQAAGAPKNDLDAFMNSYLPKQ